MQQHRSVSVCRSVTQLGSCEQFTALLPTDQNGVCITAPAKPAHDYRGFDHLKLASFRQRSLPRQFRPINEIQILIVFAFSLVFKLESLSFNVHLFLVKYIQKEDLIGKKKVGRVCVQKKNF